MACEQFVNELLKKVLQVSLISGVGLIVMKDILAVTQDACYVGF